MQNPRFLLTKSKNLAVKRALADVYETHHCCDGDSARMMHDNTADLGTLMQVNPQELKAHLAECKKNRTCFDCNLEFNDTMEFQNHLRVNCPHVKVKCSGCDQQLTRTEFRQHSCYTSYRRRSDERAADLDEIIKSFSQQNNQMKTMNVKLNDDMEDLDAVDDSMVGRTRNGMNKFFSV